MKTLKRWLNQRCIGYQHRNREISSVIEGRVEFQDGSVESRWIVSPPSRKPEDYTLYTARPQMTLEDAGGNVNNTRRTPTNE